MAGEACCTPAPPAEHLAEGELGSIGGLTAYLNKPASAKAAIVFAPDIFGYDAPLLKKLADKTAAEGYYSVVPDVFHGKPFRPSNPADPYADFGPWIAANHPDKSIDVATKIVKELKSQGIESVGVAGFCWGARLACKLASDESLLKAIVILHPSLTTLDDIKGVTCSTAVLGSEIDDYTPPALVEEMKQVLATKPFDSYTRVFPGMTHGWSIRYDVNIPAQVDGALAAQGDMLTFFKKNL